MSDSFVRTICPYCGTGCGLILRVLDGAVVECLPDRDHPVSRGHLCVKGWYAHEFIHHPERLTTPLVREGDRFRPVSWKEAVSLAAERFRATAEKYGGNAIGGCPRRSARTRRTTSFRS